MLRTVHGFLMDDENTTGQADLPVSGVVRCHRDGAIDPTLAGT